MLNNLLELCPTPQHHPPATRSHAPISIIDYTLGAGPHSIDVLLNCDKYAYTGSEIAAPFEAQLTGTGSISTADDVNAHLQLVCKPNRF